MTTERNETEQLAEELDYVTAIQKSPEAMIVFDVSEPFLQGIARKLQARIREYGTV